MAVSAGQNGTDCLRALTDCLRSFADTVPNVLHAKHSKNKTVIIIHFSRIFLYFDLHAGLTLDIFSHSDMHGSGRLAIFARVIGTPRIMYRS